MEKIIIIVGCSCREQVDPTEKIVALGKQLENLETNMAEALKLEMTKDVEANFVGTPAECRAALNAVDIHVAKAVKSRDFRDQYAAYFDQISQEILDATFAASGFADRATFDRVYDYVSEDVNGDVDRLSAITDLADLFVGLRTATGQPVCCG